MTVSLRGSLPLGGGVHAAASAVLTGEMRDFLRALRVELPFDLVCTSGLRTIPAQARAMRRNVDAHHEDPGGYLHGLYAQDDLVDEIVAGGLTEPEIEATLRTQAARGRYLSRHMRGDAVDLRRDGYTDAEIADVRAACARLGAKTVLEADHIHVERIAAQVAVESHTVRTAAVANARKP